MALVVCGGALTGCEKHTETGTNLGTSQAVRPEAQPALIDDATGPAPAVPGATSGGTIRMYSSSDFAHLDPARDYTATAQITGAMIFRALTAYREGPGGAVDVVGDLATNTGEPSDGGRTWTYHLRPGLRFEDGTAITAADVAYGVARSFSPELFGGPSYLQQWLADRSDFNARYRGPYDGGAPLPPGVSTPDRDTIVFRFPRPHADMPYAATLSTTAPVPRRHDTRAQYDNRPFASGPYRIRRYERLRKLELERNPFWDPTTDPVRHQYPDAIHCEFTWTADSANRSILADRGAHRTAFAAGDLHLPVDLYPTVTGSPALRARFLQGPTPYVWYLDINTRRVRDLAIRRALNYAVDRSGYILARGALTATPATTLLSPGLLGYQPYDVYPGGAHGDPAKARELLAGRKPRLRLAYADTEAGETGAEFLRLNFRRAGVEIELQRIDSEQYRSLIGRRDNPFDLYVTSWGADWPTASSVLPPLFDGEALQDDGNHNVSYLDDPLVNRRIDELLAVPDVNRAAPGWSELSRSIMVDHAPVVPLAYSQEATLTGSRVGGAYISRAYGAVALTHIHVK